MMKTLLVLIALAPAAAFAQGFMPRWEMSLSADANSFSDPNGGHNQVSFAVRPGFFPIADLSIEPELFVGTLKGRSPAINLSGNLSYSYGMGKHEFVPFVLAGYGAGNGFPFELPIQKDASYLSAIKFLNLGGGLKIMTLGGRALLRIEYRYQAFTADLLGVKENAYARRLLVGFSVLL